MRALVVCRCTVACLTTYESLKIVFYLQAAGAAAKEGLSTAFNMAKGLFGSKSTSEQKGPDLESEL